MAMLNNQRVNVESPDFRVFFGPPRPSVVSLCQTLRHIRDPRGFSHLKRRRCLHDLGNVDGQNMGKIWEKLDGQKFKASDIHNLCFAAKPLDNNHKLSRSAASNVHSSTCRRPQLPVLGRCLSRWKSKREPRTGPFHWPWPLGLEHHHAPSIWQHGVGP